LVYARSADEAKMIVAVENDCHPAKLGAEPKKMLTIDTMDKYFLDEV